MQENTGKYIAPIKGRVRKYLSIKGIRLSVFFAETGISESSFRGKSASSEFGGEILSTIVRTYPDISAHWLLTGEGEVVGRTESAIIGGKANVMAKEGAKVTYTHTCTDLCESYSEGNTNVSTLLETLKEQLAEKDKQMAEKDRQIEMLHKILSKHIDLHS